MQASSLNKRSRLWGKRYTHTIMLNSDGTVSPPDLPGFGAEPAYANLQQYRVM